MLPHARVRSRLGWLHRLAWWHTPSPTVFVICHCGVAGALQLAALCAELARRGRPMPSPVDAYWAWLGLALIAAIPAVLTLAIASARPRRGRVLGTLLVGVGFYVLPIAALASAYSTIALLVPVAVAWHLVLARAPASSLRGTS